MKLKLLFTTFVGLSLLLALSSCGSGQKSNNADAVTDSAAIAQDEIEVDEQLAENEPNADSIDWDVVMREIVRNLPKETVHSYFQGRIGADGYVLDDYDVCPYQSNFYSQAEMDNETHYLFTVLAAPYSDGENILVIAQAQAGVDGYGTLLLKSMNYNLKSKEFSNISDKIPGVEPDVNLLDFSWLSEHPDWVQSIKKNYQACSSYDLYVDFGKCIVENCFNDNDICYYIYDEMVADVPDWYKRLNLVYVWNGKTFELKK